jgi:hypothetical protein
MNALTRRLRAPLILVMLGVGLVGLARPARGQAPASAPPVTVETRAIPGRDVKEVTAHGIVDAPPHVVRAVIADVGRYPAFMPYVKDSRILGRDAQGAVLNYQRLSFGLPLVGDRHYVIRVAERRYRERDGRLAYAFVWRLEDGLPPGVDLDAVRVSVNSGYWDLRPAQDSDGATGVRYCVFTDPAGALPKWLVGLANTEAIPKLFAAVASEARSPRYATRVPPSGEVATPDRPTLGDCAESTSSPR